MSNETRNLLTLALTSLRVLLNGEQCDHSVGICFCAEFEIRDRIEAILVSDEPDSDEMDGDLRSGLASAGLGTDEDYGYAHEDFGWDGGRED